MIIKGLKEKLESNRNDKLGTKIHSEMCFGVS